MALILLLIGIVLIARQRVDVGSLKTGGRHVRAAGVLLTLPAILSLLLASVFVPLAFGRNTAAISFAYGVVGLIELLGMVLVVALAWVLLSDAPGLPRLPGLLGELQDEARAQGSMPAVRRRAVRAGSTCRACPCAPAAAARPSPASCR